MMSRLLLTCLLLVSPAAIFAQEIQWRQSVEVAAAECESTGRPMLLHFSAEWCNPCSELKRFVLADPEVIRSVNEQTIPVMIDTDTHPDLVKKYSITNLPSDVLVAPGDRVIFHRNSPQDRKRWKEMLDTGIVALNAMVGQDNTGYDTLVDLNQKWEESRKPAGSEEEFMIDDFHMQKPHQRSSELLLAKPSANGNVQAFSETQPAVASEADAARFSLPETVAANDSAQEENMPSANVVPTSQFYANSDSGLADARHDENILRTAAPASKPLSIANPYIADNKGPGQTSLTVKAIATGKTDSVCLDGLCPVTILEEGSWTAGNPAVGCVHRGRTYLFQTTEKRDRFLANPDRWSPLFAGYDPVDFAKTGRLVDGQRTFGIFMTTAEGQQVVLFSSAINQAEFKTSAGKFMEAIQQASQAADARNAALRR